MPSTELIDIEKAASSWNAECLRTSTRFDEVQRHGHSDGVGQLLLPPRDSRNRADVDTVVPAPDADGFPLYWTALAKNGPPECGQNNGER